MSVNWQWKDKMGTIQCSDYQGNYTLNVYSGNCLCVLTYEYIENDVYYLNYVFDEDIMRYHNHEAIRDLIKEDFKEWILINKKNG